jgi:plasmid stabilization system protein ParE
MATSYSFHPEALFEYAEAANYYLREASPRVAEAFVTAVEFAIAALVAAPGRWRAVEEPEIRRYVFSRFPFVI